jgi:hypothetical protein
MMDPVIDEQASMAGIEDLPPNPAPEERPWRETVPLAPVEEDDDGEWQAQEPTGTAGSGMPEAASQAEDPVTDTDIRLPGPKRCVNLDRV